jgi:hypothetical protein
MITAPEDKIPFREALRWIAVDAGCSVQNAIDIQNADDPVPKMRTTPGVTIHWNKNYQQGSQVAHFFDADGLSTYTSNRMPATSQPELIWIDLGPGNPWKN